MNGSNPGVWRIIKIYDYHCLEQQQHYNYILFKLTLSPVLVAMHNEGKCVHDKDSNEVSLESVSYLHYTYSHFLANKNPIIFWERGINSDAYFLSLPYN